MPVIRPFTEQDRPILNRLYQQIRAVTFHWLDKERLRQDSFDAATRDETVFVAELDGRVAGFAALYAPARFVHHLYVVPEHHGKGLGKALLAACANHGEGPLTLKCLCKNTPAVDFYRSQGWVCRSRGSDSDGDYWTMVAPDNTFAK